MLALLFLLQVGYANQLDIASKKALEAFYIQSGVKYNVETQMNIYKANYIDPETQRKIGYSFILSDIILNKKVSVRYEF